MKTHFRKFANEALAIEQLAAFRADGEWLASSHNYALDVIGAWGWLGVIPLLAGLFRYCPLYSLLGISSCSGNCKR